MTNARESGAAQTGVDRPGRKTHLFSFHRLGSGNGDRRNHVLEENRLPHLHWVSYSMKTEKEVTTVKTQRTHLTLGENEEGEKCNEKNTE